MPAVSVKQRQLMAIAEHHPSAVYAKNKGVLKMSKGQLHDYAATKQKGLPSSVKKCCDGMMAARKKGSKKK